MEFLRTDFYGNLVQQWLVAFLIAIAVAFFLRLVVLLVVRRLGTLAKKTKTPWDDLFIQMLGKTRVLCLLVLGVYIGSLLLTIPDGWRRVIDVVSIFILLLQSGIWVNAAITFWVKEYRREEHAGDMGRATTMAAIGFVCQVVVWAVVLLLALDNLGVDVTALVAALGVGGIAVALAIQNILGDLFAALAILLDKPFIIGDFLAVGDHLGSVEVIGLKTTRLRSLSGEQLVFSNNDLLTSRIKNYGRMYERRVAFSIGVTYQTPREKLLKIPAILREAIEKQEQIRFDRSHFKTFGGSSLDFETVYYILVSDYGVYMDIQQAINFHIHERFEQEGIEFAYPTQTLFIEKQGSPSTT